jgi:fibronectin type 3 domain-containing protein
VILTWKASPGKNIVGYCLYRSTQKDVAKNKPNTPFHCVDCEQINAFPVKSTACVDVDVPDNSTYFYIATAIDSHEVLSPASNEARADIRDGFSRSSSPAISSDLCREASKSK